MANFDTALFSRKKKGKKAAGLKLSVHDMNEKEFSKFKMKVEDFLYKM